MISPLKQIEYIWHGKTGFNTFFQHPEKSYRCNKLTFASTAGEKCSEPKASHRLDSAPWTEMNK